MKAIKNVSIFVLVLMTVFFMTGCSKKVIIDYADAESFENALNAGENLEGKVVQFKALELKPQSAYGYDIWAGEHLNFVSSRNPDVKAGDTVVVKCQEIQSSLGSWIINYEMVKNAISDDHTISVDSAPIPETQAAEIETEAESEISVDYSDAESFEADLNAGKNLEGKVVRFKVSEFKPNSAYGYNLWAGQHLNFISSRHPGVASGDEIVVRCTTIESNLGSWIISYEKIG